MGSQVGTSAQVARLKYLQESVSPGFCGARNTARGMGFPLSGQSLSRRRAEK